MNDWYNANEHRCYPFKETTSKSLDPREIVDCRFFLINAKDTMVYLADKKEVVIDGETKLKYTFNTSTGNIDLIVPKTPDYKVIKFNEKDIGYGFVVFGDTTDKEEEEEEEESTP